MAQVEGPRRSGGGVDSVRIGQILDEFLADGTHASEDTKYVYRLVVANNMQRFFGKIRAARLTTAHTKKYGEHRKAELLALKLKTCPNPTPDQAGAVE